MAKLPTLQLLFVILQFALLISKTFVFSQSATQSAAVDQSESNNQTDLNRKNQSSTFDSTTAATPMSENLTNSLSTADNNLDENIFLYLNTESSSESIPTTTVAPEPPESDPFDYNLFFCTCDLIGGECDVNCCCDPDCSQDDLRLFNGCWSPPSSYFDRYYCSPDPDRYGLVWNNTPEFRVQWSSRSGMFCIVTDNVPKKRLFQDRAPVTEDELLKQISPKLSGRWNDPESQEPSARLEQWIYQPYYKQGSPIFTLHINGIVSVLKLPRSLNSASCNTAQTVHFLESDNDYQCSLPGEDRCRPTIRLEEWLANLAVFRLPSYSLSSNGNAGNSSARWGDMDKLAPVVVRICQNSDSGCRSDLPAPEPSCRNSLAAVTLRITHNGTEGIRSVLADLLYTSASAGPVRFQTIHQSLAEMNRPSGGANNPLRTRSGNPGYLTGKPLLVAKLNSSSGEGAYQTLDVFPGTPKSRLIRFGEDSYHAFRMNGIKMNNRTQWCTNWSQFVLESFWGPQLQLLRLGAFGNVELNETEVSSSLWLAIRIQTEELSCFDSLIHGQLVVVYAKSGSYDQPQNKLLGAGLTLRSSGADCLVESSNRCSLQLTQTVSFVMSDSPTFMVLPQPPRWKIQLPHDFFYPFLLSSAGSVLLSPSITLPLFLVVVFYGR